MTYAFPKEKTISLESLSQADSSFLNGDFIDAGVLYSEALSGLDQINRDSNETSTLLQKLGDSDYAAGHYQRAARSYERLLQLPHDHSFGKKELLFAHLKLAKAYDFCEGHTEAGEQFNIAYELAKLNLPADHFLRRTIIESYATWLAKSGHDSNLLAILQDELGISVRNEENNADEPEPLPDQPEKSQKSEPRKNDADFNDLRGKLHIQRHRVLSSERKAEKKMPRPKYKSVLQQVVERRFLVKSDENLGPVPEKKKLRSTLSGEDSPALDSQSLQAEHFEIAPTELGFKTVNSDHAATSGLNLRSTRDVAMRNSNRSFFNDGTAGNLTGEVLPRDCEEIDAKATPAIAIGNDGQKSPKETAAIAIAAFICSALGLLISISASNTAEPPAFYRALIGKRLATADGALSVSIATDGLTFIGKGIRKTVKPELWHGSFSEEISLMGGGYNNCIWLSPTASGMQDQNGRQFIAQTAPEIQTVKIMTNIAAEAQRFYAASGRYPGTSEIQPNLYRNPCTTKIDQLSVYSMFTDGSIARTGAGRLQTSLQNGQPFNNEVSGKPGTVAAFCIKNQSQYFIPGSQTPQECQSLYLHGFDRNGSLIKSTDSNKTLLLSLCRGAMSQTEATETLAKYSHDTFCLSAHDLPGAAEVFFKYLVLLLIFGTVVGFVLWSKKSVQEN